MIVVGNEFSVVMAGYEYDMEYRCVWCMLFES